MQVQFNWLKVFHCASVSCMKVLRQHGLTLLPPALFLILFLVFIKSRCFELNHKTKTVNKKENSVILGIRKTLII